MANPATRVINDIVYAPVSSWEKHTLDIYHPSIPNQDRSLIVFIHGGAWRTGDKNEFVDLAKNLAESTGDTVAVPTYTLSIADIKDDPTSVPARAQHPKHVQDVALALGHLYTLASDTEIGGYNPNKMYLVGHSAGGQITGLLGLRPDLYLDPVEIQLGLTRGSLHNAVKGIIGVEGIYNVDRLLKVWPSYREFVIQGFGQDPEALIHGSPHLQEIPRRLVNGVEFALPRYAIIHSNQDELVDPAQATDFHDYLQSVHPKQDIALEFGDWGSHDDMLQTAQFTRTITAYIHAWSQGEQLRKAEPTNH
ncbi:Kynurenine formamidase [Podila humilis]|nr:Kynurenine formamidase [Podila humilis]